MSWSSQGSPLGQVSGTELGQFLIIIKKKTSHDIQLTILAIFKCSSEVLNIPNVVQPSPPSVSGTSSSGETETVPSEQ